MPPPWSQPLEVDRLARGEAAIAVDVPLAELPRLRSRIAGIEGHARGVVRFARHKGFVVVELALVGGATLQCQRCMQAMELSIDGTTRVALIGSEANAAQVPDEFEPVLAREGRISIGELVEEEMLLALPIVALHAQLRDCVLPMPVAFVQDAGPEHAGQRPFEGLAERLQQKIVKQ